MSESEKKNLKGSIVVLGVMLVGLLTLQTFSGCRNDYNAGVNAVNTTNP